MRKLLVYSGMMVLGAILLFAAMLLLSLGMSTSTSVAYLKLIQLLQSFLVFILPALLAPMLWYRSGRDGLGWLRVTSCPHAWQWPLLVVLLMLVAIPAINLLAWLNEQIVLPSALATIEQWMRQMEDAAQQATEMMIKADSIGVLLVNILLMAALPAIGEELTFRGIVQGLIAKRQPSPEVSIQTTALPHIAVWTTAFLFSAIHLQFYGFIPRLLLGTLLGYLLLWSGSLWIPVLAHFTNNAIAVLTYYVGEHYLNNPSSLDALGTEETWYLGVLSIVLVSGLLWYMHRMRISQQRPLLPPNC